MTTYYVFVDTVNGTATPANDTPDTATSKYHTTSSWPANGARWASMGSALGNAIIEGLAGDIVCLRRGTTDDTTRVVVDSLNWLSLTITAIEAGCKLVYSSTAQSAYYSDIPVNTTIDGLDILYNGSHATPSCTYHTARAGTRTFKIKNAKILISGSGTGTGGALYHDNVTGFTATYENCIIAPYGSPGGVRDGTTGAKSLTVMNAYNCVIHGFNNGAYGFDTIKNCAVFDNTDDFLSCTTVAYCASDDGDGTSAVSGLTWVNQFTDYTNGDYTVKAGASLIGAGIGPTSDANVPATDKIGTARSGATTDIGAYMYVVSGLSITSVTPSSFDDGHTGIVIAGSGFGATQGASTLMIGSQAQTVTAWSDTSITFTCVRDSGGSMGARQLVLTKG